MNCNKKRQFLIGVGFMFCLLLQSCGMDLPEEVQLTSKQLPKKIDFNFHVKPILSDKCFACHGPDLANQKGGLRLDTEKGAFALSKESGKKAIVPGKLGKSELVHRVLTDDQNLRMPPLESNLQLDAYEKAVLLKWIEQGALYKKHWAYIPPEKKPLPKVQGGGQIINEIDAFIIHELEKNGLQFQAEADKETLLRRLSFDLTGLPPSITELAAFLNDHSEDAYEKVVDRLLASPHFGEKMATDWMDVARYADTHGYSVDRYRPMWPWRDWVINAFNENMPYDQFITWQLAGDLLPNASKEQKLATAFNRNHAQNMEGGIVNEEFRIEYVTDRTNTLGKALLAMTFECAKCHDHKFDPISQKEYFEVFSFFNQVDEAGQISWDNATPVPTMLLTDEHQDSIILYLERAIKVKEDALKGLQNKAIAKVTNAAESSHYESYLNHGLLAHYDFEKLENRNFINRLNHEQKASLVEVPNWKKSQLTPELVDGKSGRGFLSNGDDPLLFDQIGVFHRAQPFSIGLWAKFPQNLETGMIFHKGEGAIIYSFRGYHLALRNNKLEVMMVHTWPYNNIIKVSTDEVPKEEWMQLTLTYDGSSKAEGLKVYLNGKLMDMLVEKDNLYKDILFPTLNEEPSLKVGARWRGTGIKGGAVDELRVYNRALLATEVAMLAGKKGVLSTQEEKELSLVHYSLDYQQQQHALTQLRTSLNALLDSIPEIMVIDELKEKRKTYLLERGAYDAPGVEVGEGTPLSILPFADTLPKNRLGLTQWLFAPDNPLTARVIVNRYWQSYFGNGIVKSSADFGNQGDLPTHPDLLDWLAVQFRASGWDVKAMQKLIVMSATYRQTSLAPKEILEKDYDNSLLSRGPSSRLSAEMLRDNALFASGLMVEKIGGESVKPYQPEGLWRFNSSTYVRDSGEKLYRRSLYTFWKRTVPPPTMNTYDAPSRSYCVVKRQETSTPLQSLVLLNDPQFIEASRALASQAIQQEKDHLNRLTFIYRALTSKVPKTNALELLDDYFISQKAEFEKHPEKGQGWLEVGESPNQNAIDQTALASYTLVASMVMNSLDATMKR